MSEVSIEICLMIYSVHFPPSFSLVERGNLSKIGARRIIRLNQNGHVETCPPLMAQYILFPLPTEMSSVSHICSLT